MKYFDKDKAIEGIKKFKNEMLRTHEPSEWKLGISNACHEAEVMINNNIKSKPETKSAKEYKNVYGYYDFPIDTIFKFKGKKYKVIKVEKGRCYDCDFKKVGNINIHKMKCGGGVSRREDGNNVIFKEIK